MSDNGVDISHGNGNVEDNAMRHGGEASMPAPAPADDAVSKRVEDVLYSDIGVNTLLNRLKQSIASARDLAGFLKKRSSLEEDHAQGLKKLCRATHETIRRPETRHGTYAQQFEEVTRVHERMAENGMQFALSLHQMHEDLNELSNNMERGRKHWKQTGLSAEKKVMDAEMQMEKAKSKYDSLAEEYDRVKTGDSSARKFGLKGVKSGAQLEEDLKRRVEAADQDYASRVQYAQAQRQDLINLSRPQAVKALQELISECDSAVTLQLQKFAAFNEKLLLGNGILVSPLKESEGAEPQQRSLRDMVHQINNEKDFQSYISNFTSKVPSRTTEIKYEKHPTLSTTQQTPPSARRQSGQFQPGPYSQPPPSFAAQPAQQPSMPQNYQAYNAPHQQQPSAELGPAPPPQQQHAPPYPQHSQSNPPYGQSPYAVAPPQQVHAPQQQSSVLHPSGNLPPMRPVFGVSLEDLFRRDQTPVPMVVYQCTQAVDLFGLDVEGIYRVPGTQQHINQLKAMFDNDSSKVDFRNPENFFHDVNSVAGLLKQFFRDLPDPLFTSEHYTEFIEAARIEDETVRRDSLHAIINALPDSNYATLRALVLHLNRVQEHFHSNRMSTTNLALCFAPTLLGPHRGAMHDAGLQARVVDTILLNTYQIFDED